MKTYSHPKNVRNDFAYIVKVSDYFKKKKNNVIFNVENGQEEIISEGIAAWNKLS